MKGAEQEALALAYLQRQGLKLIAQNYRARGGELDLVMRQGDTLVIAEVRKRANTAFGSAAESVDARKRARLILATQWLLSERPELGKLAVRFDVIALDAADRIDWIRNAFDTDG